MVCLFESLSGHSGLQERRIKGSLYRTKSNTIYRQWHSSSTTTILPLLIFPPPGMGAHPPSPPRTYQICLMVNGHFTDNKNDMYDAFYNWLQASLPKGSNVKFQLDPYEAQEKKYPLRAEIDKYDVVLLSGSRMCLPRRI